jgi:DNA-binding NarL/FixJ family response regulator
MPTDLTPEERNLIALSLSMSDEAVSERTGLAVQTIRNRRAMIYSRLGVKGQGDGRRGPLLDVARLEGWLKVPETT